MSKRIIYPLLALLLTACYRPAPTAPDVVTYYAVNYNFIIKTDSIAIVCQQPDELPFDSVTLHRGERVVVADFIIMPQDTIDSVWVMIARDQQSMGWIREAHMLPIVTPDEPISQCIDAFSNVHRLIFIALVLIVALTYAVRMAKKQKTFLVLVKDIRSPYPTALVILVAVAATYYSSLQLFAPEAWRYYYYHPSLNPITLEPAIGIFITLVWTIIIVGIAAIDETFRLIRYTDAIIYALGLGAVCALTYLTYSFLTLYYIGYPLLIIGIAAAARLLHHQHP